MKPKETGIREYTARYLEHNDCLDMGWKKNKLLRWMNCGGGDCGGTGIYKEWDFRR